MKRNSRIIHNYNYTQILNSQLTGFEFIYWYVGGISREALV